MKRRVQASGIKRLLHCRDAKLQYSEREGAGIRRPRFPRIRRSAIRRESSVPPLRRAKIDQHRPRRTAADFTAGRKECIASR